MKKLAGLTEAEPAENQTSGYVPLKRDLYILVAASLVFVLTELFVALGFELPSLAGGWLYLALSVVVQIVFGLRLFCRNHGGTSRAAAFISSAALALGAYSLFFVSGGIRRALVCFASQTSLITLSLLSERLVYRTKNGNPGSEPGKLSDAIAHVRRGNRELDVPAGEIVPGDVLTVKTGELIPADGVIIGGLCTVDESALTGSDEPVDKWQGDKVFCSTLNKFGSFEMQAEKVGTDTAFSRIARAANKTRQGEPPGLRTSIRVYGIFLWCSVVVSLAVFALWYLVNGNLVESLQNALLTLVMAYPYATSFAAVRGFSSVVDKAAENGVLIRDGSCLETAHKVDTVLLDKTYAVMEGRPEVTEITAFDGFFQEEVLTFAAAAEKNSDHPIGRAIREYSQPSVLAGDLTENIIRAWGGELIALHSESRGFVGSAIPTAEKTESLPGLGVRASVGGREVLVGTRRLMGENGIKTNVQESVLTAIESGGSTAVIVAINRRLAGVIAVSDTVKQSAKKTVRRLKEMGAEVCMLTGDSERTALAVANQSGFDHVLAGILPPEKLGGIERLKALGRTVSVAGRGGDPAVKAADIGFALNSYADSEDTSDVTLVHGDLNALTCVFELSRILARTSKRNLFFALAYNAACIPLAASGIFSPVMLWLAAALSFVSIAITSETVRVKG